MSVCLIAAGIVAATLPTADFTVEWQHSVQKTRWQERYRVDGTQLTLVRASVESMGAGMEPPPEARLADGRWTWEPMRQFTELRLARSSFAPDYVICWSEHCSTLSALTGEEEPSVIVLRSC